MRARLSMLCCVAVLTILLTPKCAPAGIAGFQLENAVTAEQNIALGCRVIFDVSPNYPYTIDDSDPLKLTDGLYADTAQPLWMQGKTTVGWYGCRENYPSFTVDMGKTQPIEGASYSTASGNGIPWPTALLIMVSNDAKTWSYAGDLVELSGGQDMPPVQTYSTHRFVTHSLHAYARYVKVIIITRQYAFCDEFEVYGGTDNIADMTYPIPSTRSFIQGFLTRLSVANTISSDLSKTSVLLRESDLTPDQMITFQDELDNISAGLNQLPMPDPAAFRAIVPYNELHARVLSIYGMLRQAQGYPRLSVWKKNRYDLVSYMDVPPDPTTVPSVDISMMRNEYRGDSILLTNSSKTPIDVEIKVRNMPGSPNPSWLSVYAIPWTGTSTPTVVGAAFVPAGYWRGCFQISIPAGMTQKIWFEVDSSKLSPGDYNGYLDVGGNHVPFGIHVSAIALQTPRLSLGMWDYAFGQGLYSLTPSNIPAAIKSMREHFVDSPWGLGSALKDANSSLDDFDSWISRWSGARNYLAFVNVSSTFAGASIGTPEFEEALRVRLKEFTDHLAYLGIPQERVGLLLVDEPRTQAQYDLDLAWATVIKTYAPGVRLFADVDLLDLSDPKVQQILTCSDILCPQLSRYYMGGTALAGQYANLMQSGHALWFYQTDGPAKVLDPYTYYRLTAWYAFRNGATGIGFWSFGDIGGAVSSWNECSIYAGKSYSPVFIDSNSVTDGIHWEAVREGVEDYEYLSMLRDAARRSVNRVFRTEALNLIAESMNAVVGNYDSNNTWRPDVDHERADCYRLKILALLETKTRGSLSR